MPRKKREKSGTGIYHVMMRGINHQDIFEDRGDYWKFLKLLRMQTHPEDNTGKPLPAHCIVYAYCLMSNQVHSGTDPIVHFFAHFFVWYIIILYLCLQKLESVCLEKKERRAVRGFTM